MPVEPIVPGGRQGVAFLLASPAFWVASATVLMYCPWWPDAWTTPRQVVLLLGLAWLWQPVKLTLVHLLTLLWLAYVALAAYWAPDRTGALGSLLDLALLVGVLWIGRGEELLSGACVGVAGLGALACWESWQGQISGQLLGNPNYLGEAAAIGISWALVGRRWGMALCLCPALVLSGSRASLLGLGLVVVWLGYRQCRGLWARFILVDLALGALVWAMVFSNSTSLFMRLDWWQVALENLVPFGHGPGSFWQSLPVHNVTYFQGVMQERPEWPHNELVDWLFTLGLGAIFPIALCFVLWQDKARRPLWLCVAVVVALGFPLHVPSTILLLGSLAGLSAEHLPRLGLARRPWRDAGKVGVEPALSGLSHRRA